MTGLTEADLAERSGVTPDRIDRLVELDILAVQADGSFRPADIPRIRLVEALERSGIALEDIGRAVASGHLSFSFLDLLFTEPRGQTAKTYREVCAEMGWTLEFVQHAHEALGLPPPGPDDRVREDDLQMFPIAQFALGSGVPEAGVLRSLRVYGDNLRRIAEAEAQFFHTYIEEPLLHSGMAEGQLLEMASQMSPQLRANVEGMISWLYRRYQEHSIIEHVVGHVEEAMEQAGVSRQRIVRPPAMMFLDLAGYTRLTEERGDDAAAELAASLAELVLVESGRQGGRPIKWLGDGVMFHFSDPAHAISCALDLVERAPATGMPPAHCGVNAGPVVFRDGDYFGRTVNIAARIAAKAGPGEVLASEETVMLASVDGVGFEQIGPVELKGLSKPVVLYRAKRSGGAGLQSG